jgi:periplasmic protein TonB
MAQKKHFRVYLPRILGGVVLFAVIGYMIYFVVNLKGDKTDKKEKKPQQVTLVKPPPPPPPPPKVEKPPEPPKEKIEEPVPEPEPEPEEPVPDVEEAPPGEDLGLDAEGGAGSDGFGLVGRKGGRGLFGGGGGGSPFARYGKMAANEIREVLSENEKLRRKGYTAVGKLWLEPDGTVKKIELARGSNDSDIDELLVRTLNKLKKINEPPPSTMEQPIKFKITVRL